MYDRYPVCQFSCGISEIPNVTSIAHPKSFAWLNIALGSINPLARFVLALVTSTA
jgi:hypothetical protein